jgi:hypothetical protein
MNVIRKNMNNKILREDYKNLRVRYKIHKEK